MVYINSRPLSIGKHERLQENQLPRAYEIIIKTETFLPVVVIFPFRRHTPTIVTFATNIPQFYDLDLWIGVTTGTISIHVTNKSDSTQLSQAQYIPRSNPSTKCSNPTITNSNPTSTIHTATANRQRSVSRLSSFSWRLRSTFTTIVTGTERVSVCRTSDSSLATVVGLES